MTLFRLGVAGNALVVISVGRHKTLQSVRNIFIVSLSISDIIVSLVSGSITPISAFSKNWIFGGTLCKIVPLLQGSSLCFSTLTLTAISIDRFFLVLYPTKRSIEKRHAFRMIFLNWFLATIISLPMFFKQQLISYGDFCGQFCSEDWGEDSIGRSTYGTIVFVLQFVVPVIIICFCYSMISIRLGKVSILIRFKVNSSFTFRACS
jgi:neuropeptide Y receptor